MTTGTPHPGSGEALAAARVVMLTAMSASTGAEGYSAALESAQGIPAGRVLEVLALLGVLAARRGEILLEAAVAAEIFGESAP